MNFIQIAGRLGADPEVRFTANGQKVTNLRVATNSRRGGKEETIWWRVTIWSERFDKMISYLKKGSAIIAVGRMHKPEIYTDKQGNPQVSLEITAEMIEFSPFGKSDMEENSNDSKNQGQTAYTPSSFSPDNIKESNNKNEDDFLAYATADASNDANNDALDSSDSKDDGLPF